jgi:hypothetical protein
MRRLEFHIPGDVRPRRHRSRHAPYDRNGARGQRSLRDALRAPVVMTATTHVRRTASSPDEPGIVRGNHLISPLGTASTRATGSLCPDFHNATRHGVSPREFRLE